MAFAMLSAWAWAWAKSQRSNPYWLDPGKRGEGLNLVDFAAQKYGNGFPVETGMRQPFARRVHQHLLTVKTAVKLFEERYR